MPVQPQNEIQDWVALFIIAVVLFYWLLRVTVLLIAARGERRRQGEGAGIDASGGAAAPARRARDAEAGSASPEAPQPADQAPPTVVAPSVVDVALEVPPELLAPGASAAQAEDVARLIEATRYVLATARRRGNLVRQIDMQIHLADLYLLAGDRPQARRSLAAAEALLQSATPAEVTAHLAEGSELAGEQFLALRRARLERIRVHLETL